MLKRITFSLAAILILTASALAQDKPKSNFFTTKDGVKIHYLTLGNKGSWVVLIHGYTDSAQRMWFTTGIAPALAKNHRVVAIDNRNHGQSDKPQPGGSGRAEDVIELMDLLKIQKAHIHGYSMGGGITGRLLALIPDRFITAGFGGSGLSETDPELRAKAAALDAALPRAQGRDAEGMDRFRSRVSSLRTGTPGGANAATSGAAAPSGSNSSANSSPASSGTASRREGSASSARAGARPTPTGNTLDLTKVTIPIIAINGSFDNPYSKTHRLWREARNFQNVILPEKTHLTAIAVGAPMPQEYITAMVKFIDSNDANR